MKKIYNVIAVIFFAQCIVFAGGKKESALSDSRSQTDSAPRAEKIRAGALVGPSGLGMAYMFAHVPSIGNTSVEYEACASVDVLLPKLINGDLDVGILPPNVAAKLYNSNPESIVALATVGRSMLALITSDPAIHTLSDLVGHTVSVAGQGSTPDYVFQTLLASEGIVNQVTLDYSIPTPEIAAAVISGKIKYALVPEPFATVAVINSSNSSQPVKRAILMKELWTANGFGNDFPMTLVVARTEFARKYPESLAQFLESYEKSILWTISNPDEAGPIVEAANLGLKAAIATKAIPFCNFVYINAIDNRSEIENLLTVFLKFAPIAIGGKLPGEGFYWK